jgi:hypothetical protein
MKAMVLMVLQMAMHAATLVIIAKPEYGTCRSEQGLSEWKDMLHAADHCLPHHYIGSGQQMMANATCHGRQLVYFMASAVCADA